MLFIYMRYNLEMLIQFEVDLEDMLKIDAEFFAQWMQAPQMLIAFAMVTVVGPALISPDLRNNALPLYLSRPLSKTSYILGKLLVLVTLCSMVTWIPALALIGFQAYLAEDGWLLNNLRIPAAAVTSAMAWIVCLSMLSLAVSAWVKWKAIARLIFFGLAFVGSGLSTAIREMFGGWTGSLVSLFDTAEVLVMGLYGTFTWQAMPVEVALLALVVITLMATALLTRRIRAFEIIS
jgi:heme exporter protein D